LTYKHILYQLTVHENELAHDDDEVFQRDGSVSASVTPHYRRENHPAHRESWENRGVHVTCLYLWCQM